jgi:hypothetical protein
MGHTPIDSARHALAKAEDEPARLAHEVGMEAPLECRLRARTHARLSAAGSEGTDAAGTRPPRKSPPCHRLSARHEAASVQRSRATQPAAPLLCSPPWRPPCPSCPSSWADPRRLRGGWRRAPVRARVASALPLVMPRSKRNLSSSEYDTFSNSVSTGSAAANRSVSRTCAHSAGRSACPSPRPATHQDRRRPRLGCRCCGRVAQART